MMRAGFLLLGFLLMFSFPVGDISVFPLGGFLLILLAVLRLEKFEKIFSPSKYALSAAAVLSLALLVFQILRQTAAVASDGAAGDIYTLLRLAVEIAEITVMVMIYPGFKVIAVKSGVKSLEKLTYAAMTVMFAYIVFQIIVTVIRVFIPEILTGFEIVIVYPFALGYIWRAVNVWIAFTLLTKVSGGKT